MANTVPNTVPTVLAMPIIRGNPVCTHRVLPRIGAILVGKAKDAMRKAFIGCLPSDGHPKMLSCEYKPGQAQAQSVPVLAVTLGGIVAVFMVALFMK